MSCERKGILVGVITTLGSPESRDRNRLSNHLNAIFIIKLAMVVTGGENYAEFIVIAVKIVSVGDIALRQNELGGT